jgi:hypothetical protein
VRHKDLICKEILELEPGAEGLQEGLMCTGQHGGVPTCDGKQGHEHRHLVCRKSPTWAENSGKSFSSFGFLYYKSLTGSFLAQRFVCYLCKLPQ